MVKKLAAVGQVIAACSLLLVVAACNKQQNTDQSAASSVGSMMDDTVISTKVREALLANDDVKSYAIKVNTENGQVVLSGFVNNQNQIDLSMKIAKGINGVKDVSNELSIKDSTAAANEKIGDDLVTTTVKTALLNDSVLKSFDIAVVTRHGEVMLSGFVDSQAQALHSVDIAQGVEGVTSVLNHMTVKS
jgi:hyperosmotically inducible protein